jgi:hypothetical protein
VPLICRGITAAVTLVHAHYAFWLTRGMQRPQLVGGVVAFECDGSIVDAEHE